MGDAQNLSRVVIKILNPGVCKQVLSGSNGKRLRNLCDYFQRREKEIQTFIRNGKDTINLLLVYGNPEDYTNKLAGLIGPSCRRGRLTLGRQFNSNYPLRINNEGEIILGESWVHQKVFGNPPIKVEFLSEKVFKDRSYNILSPEDIEPYMMKGK